MEGHRLRVGALAWSSSVLSSGSRDKIILQRDIRAQDDFVSKLAGHKSEVCGLKWSYDNRQLGSGGNDNRLFVWNQHSNQPVLKYSEHTAAVKAIAWSPHVHGLLASGGGTADRCIRFWNTTTNSHLNCIDTGSQHLVGGTADRCIRFWNTTTNSHLNCIDTGKGMQPCMVKECQRNREHSWLFPKSNNNLAVPEHVEGILKSHQPTTSDSSSIFIAES
ncbi:Protein FIZZY-RELATED 2 [Platanthera guangdongensis]|uniref:Protein FIZZY-RELATED 2 n=1 Tax=Platanthera guangdongensis TaxID=2320717 RepID=A0ABR2MMZ0_9ASPA